MLDARGNLLLFYYKTVACADFGVLEKWEGRVDEEKRRVSTLQPILVSYSRTAHQPCVCVSATDSDS
jgi:hypothetical protein